MTKTADVPQKVFVISRTFSAPRELLWKVWTDPKHLQHWFGPKGFTGRVVKMDVRPGGMYHYLLTGTDGTEIWGKMMYREIDQPKRLVFVNAFSDEKGGLGRHPMDPSWPQQMLTTVTFEEMNGKTTVTIRWVPIEATEEERRTFDEGHESMKQGWTGTFEQLEEYLRSVNA